MRREVEVGLMLALVADRDVGVRAVLVDQSTSRAREIAGAMVEPVSGR